MWNASAWYENRGRVRRPFRFKWRSAGPAPRPRTGCSATAVCRPSRWRNGEPLRSVPFPGPGRFRPTFHPRRRTAIRSRLPKRAGCAREARVNLPKNTLQIRELRMFPQVKATPSRPERELNPVEQPNHEPPGAPRLRPVIPIYSRLEPGCRLRWFSSASGSVM